MDAPEIPEPSDRPSLAQRLGYPADARLLLVHADDLGMAHSVNAAAIQALATGRVPSASIMAPCAWFPEIAAYARDHPDADLGIHLTLTSEWSACRWGPVLSKERVPSLLDAQGYFHATARDLAAHADPQEAEAEMRAQIDRALAFGIRPTHLDVHMFSVGYAPALFEAYLRVGRAYRLPVLVPRNALEQQAPHLLPSLTPDDLLLDHLVPLRPETPLSGWGAHYARVVAALPPGVAQIILHPAFDNEEMRAMTSTQHHFGAAWRQCDFDFFTSAAFEDLLARHGITPITWREIGRQLL